MIGDRGRLGEKVRWESASESLGRDDESGVSGSELEEAEPDAGERTCAVGARTSRAEKMKSASAACESTGILVDGD